MAFTNDNHLAEQTNDGCLLMMEFLSRNSTIALFALLWLALFALQSKAYSAGNKILRERERERESACMLAKEKMNNSPEIIIEISCREKRVI